MSPRNTSFSAKEISIVFANYNFLVNGKVPRRTPMAFVVKNFEHAIALLPEAKKTFLEATQNESCEITSLSLTRKTFFQLAGGELLQKTHIVEKNGHLAEIDAREKTEFGSTYYLASNFKTAEAVKAANLPVDLSWEHVTPPYKSAYCCFCGKWGAVSNDSGIYNPEKRIVLRAPSGPRSKDPSLHPQPTP